VTPRRAAYTFANASRSREAQGAHPMFGLGTPELVIVLVIVLVLFGGAKLPQMMKGLGEGMKEFRNATRDEDDATTRDNSHKTGV
jgi:sec-independent protein translocase protein TatA